MCRDLKAEEIKGIIAAFSAQAVNGPVRRMVVSRSNVWDSSVQLWTMPNFKNRKGELLVKFVGDYSGTEPSIDQGGPRREYFRLLLKAILVQSGIFSTGKLADEVSCFVVQVCAALKAGRSITGMPMCYCVFSDYIRICIHTNSAIRLHM